MTVRLHLPGEQPASVTRPGDAASWRADVACPVCGLRPIRVRAYPGERGPPVEGHDTAPAWCAGRHDAPVGYLSERAVLHDLGGQTEGDVRCRVYG